jgi:hypothetical protein
MGEKLKLATLVEKRALYRKLGSFLLICFVLVSAFILIKGIVTVKNPILMRTTATGGPYFDATKWFDNGMYKQRKEVIMGKEVYSDVSMLRVNPPPFPGKQNIDLASWAAYVLERYYPNENTDILLLSPPDLCHRMVYIGSGFDSPDKPIDGYTLYLTLGKKRFTINFSRDGVSGEIIHASSAFLVEKDDEKAEFFQKLEEQERSHGNEKCP